MQSFKIIGISGVGRAGKDSFYRFASEYLNSEGITTGRWAFADELKKDMDVFISEKFGFSAFTENTEEKNKIRPLLVEYGKVRRKDSKGQYWLNKIRDTLLAPEGPQVRFITDLRFAEFGGSDELSFVKSNGGKIVHVERYESKDWYGQFHVLGPANIEEEKNDPVIRKAADVQFRWHDFARFENSESIPRAEVERVMQENSGLWKEGGDILRKMEKWVDSELKEGLQEV
jgi:hypothetical protein